MSAIKIFRQAKFHSAYGLSEQLPPPTLPEIALVGRSNVGKSSLLNRLCEQKSLARQSSSPGKTITVNYFAIDGAFIVDLPGYGYAKRAHSEQLRFSELCESYVVAENSNRIFLQLLDARRGITPDDAAMMELFADRGEYFVAVVTKIDKLNKTEYATLQRSLTIELSQFGCETVFTSSQNGEGYEYLRQILWEFLKND